MARRKVSVIGAGNVGATAAQRIVDKELADVVLVDIVPGSSAGQGTGSGRVRSDRGLRLQDDGYE